MTEQEKQDLDAMKAAVAMLKTEYFDNMRNVARWPTKKFKFTGYTTFLGIFYSYQQRIEKLQAEYFKKYPDLKCDF
jgi:hypothetical protein